MATGTRLMWHPTRLVDRWDETGSAVTLVFGVPGWPGHLPGQHVDVRLTAEDGYSTQRSYSLAAPDHGARVELTVQVVEDGEVSPFLAKDLGIGDPVELRGPVGGWFVWRPGTPGPVFLAGGGSGVVPLMAMVRARHEAGSAAPFHLVYSVRSPDEVYYAAELERRVRHEDGLRVTVVHSRRAPLGASRPAGRLDAAELAELAWPAGREPLNFVCGPTGFVDEIATALVTLGHPEHRVRTERFGASG
ncbi:MAG TPA: ferredoxin reductase [Nocardioidaceae bacterium]